MCFLAMLHFIYVGNADLSYDTAMDLLEVDKYSLPKLKRSCEEYLSSIITEERFVAMAKAATKFEAFLLTESIFTFIEKNRQKLKDREDLQELPQSFFIDYIFSRGKRM